MAVAISFRSESGDDYLKLFDGNPTPETVLEMLKEEFREEWEFLYIQNVASTFSNAEYTEKIEDLLTSSIEETPRKDYDEDDY